MTEILLGAIAATLVANLIVMVVATRRLAEISTWLGHSASAHVRQAGAAEEQLHQSMRVVMR